MLFNYIPLYSKFVKSETELENIAGNFFKALDSIGGRRVDKNEGNDMCPLFYFMVTGGTEQYLEKARSSSSNPNDPVYLIAHPSHNSLPASLESLAKYHQENISGRIFYLDDEKSIKELESFIKKVNSSRNKVSLKDSKIGLIGEPSDWLIASKPDFSIIRSVWGPSIVPISIEEIENEINRLTDQDVLLEYKDLLSDPTKKIEPSEKDLLNNAKVYVAIKKITSNKKLDAITIRCFDLLLDLSTSGCYALSKLNNIGLIAGCEGDLVSTVTMLWIYKLLNKTSWMANLSIIDSEKNTIWLAHCTVPTSMVKSYNLRSHFESGISVGIEGEFEKGPITLIRIGGKYMEKIWISEGELISTGNSEKLCRTQAEIKLHDKKVSDLLNNPLGNHLILVEGHYSKFLYTWWRENIFQTFN